MADKNPNTILELRRKYEPVIPECLKNLGTVTLEEGGQTTCVGNEHNLRQIFPKLFGQPKLLCGRSDTKVDRVLRVGFVLSGGPAAGGHNVVCGLYDALQELNPQNVVIGFLRGPMGLIKNDHCVITKEMIEEYRNTGGFDMVGSGRDKIEKEEQLESSMRTALACKLDGLLVIGGDDSNTNACVVGEYFSQNDCDVRVVGIPKTIDGDLQNEDIEISFGFATATRTYSEMVSNIARDSRSAVKAWHFIKLMGRDASHVTLETALQTQPNVALISEEVRHEHMKFSDVIDLLADAVCRRSKLNKNYGVVLVPEGLLQFIPSFSNLIDALSTMLSNESPTLPQIEELQDIDLKLEAIAELLTSTHKATFKMLPKEIARELIAERDPHGNVAISKVPTELLLIRCVEDELLRRKKVGTYKGKFKAHGHFFGYDGRAGFPTNFDCNYCYNLGRVGALLVLNDMSGYMARVYNLAKPPEEWLAGATPLTSMMNMEKRHGKMKPVIKKALVDVENEPAMWFFQRERSKWVEDDAYLYPGPIQFFGPPVLTNASPKILQIRAQSKK